VFLQQFFQQFDALLLELLDFVLIFLFTYGGHMACKLFI